jgi:hypothetical protein
MRKGILSVVVASGLLVSNSFADLNDGLVAHYEFEDNANDSSENGNHGTEYGGVSYVDGVIGKAIEFHNVDNPSYYTKNDYITINEFDIGTQLTISHFIKFNSNAHEHSGATYSFGDDSEDIFFRFYTTTNGLIGVQLKNIDSSLGTIDVSDNEWKLISLTINDTKVKLFQNGEFISESNISNIQDFSGLKHYIAFHNWYSGSGGSSRFNGLVDDLRIYNRALSENEIKKLYNLPFLSEQYYTLIDELQKRAFETSTEWSERVESWSYILNRESNMSNYNADTQTLTLDFDLSDINITQNRKDLNISIDKAKELYKQDEKINTQFILNASIDSSGDIVIDLDYVLLEDSSVVVESSDDFFAEIVKSLTKGEFESADNHKDRITQWNEQNLVFDFDITLSHPYDPDTGVLYASVDTSVIEYLPISVAISIDSIGMGDNIATFIDSMKASMQFKLYFDYNSNRLKAILLRNTLDITPNEYTSKDFINVGMDLKDIEDIKESLSQGWYESDDDWKSRVESFNQKVVMELTKLGESDGYGYDANNNKMGVTLELDKFGFESKEINIDLSTAEDVIDFYNRGSSTINLKAKVENDEAILYHDCTYIVLGKELISFSMDGKDSVLNQICEDTPLVENKDIATEDTPLYTQAELDAKFEDGKEYCKNNPVECGISTNCINSSGLIDKTFIDGQNSGWTLLGDSVAISDFSIFENSSIVWSYQYGIWSAYSPIATKNLLIQNNSNINSLNNIPANQGFWIYK